MSIVSSLRESQWTKDDGTQTTTYWVGIDGANEVPCYDEKAKELKLNGDLPSGWEVKTSQKGKPYLAVPRERKGGAMPAAFRNTKEGQFYEQERMDRRTALMQAVSGFPETDRFQVLDLADAFYAWLRATAGAGVLPLSPPAPAPTSPAPVRAGSKAGGNPKPVAPAPAAGDAPVGTGGNADGEAAPSGPCTHETTSPLKPDGSALPAGKVRCLDCNTVTKEAS